MCDYLGSMKVIAIVGVYRSGSTWMFNVVKTILKEAGYSVTWRNDPYKEDALESDADFHIIKMHEYYEKLHDASDIILTSRRSFNGVERSYRQLRYDITVDNDTIRDMFIEYGKWHLFTNYDMEFVDMVTDRLKVVADLTRTVLPEEDHGVKFWQGVLDIVDEIKPPKKGFDPDTLLFSHHISKR